VDDDEGARHYAELAERALQRRGSKRRAHLTKRMRVLCTTTKFGDDHYDEKFFSTAFAEYET
jgi:hypothetical protein